MKNYKFKLMIIVLLMLAGLALFLAVFGETIYHFFSNWLDHHFMIDNWQCFGLIYMCILMGLSAFFCFRLSKNKHRNPFLWTTLGLLFNVWPLLILFLLPPLRSKKRA